MHIKFCLRRSAVTGEWIRQPETHRLYDVLVQLT